MMIITTVFRYIGLFAAAGIAAWLVWVFVTNISAADASVKAGLIGLLGMFSVAIVSNYQTKNREIDARHFLHKREGYMKLIDLVFDLIQSQKANRNVPNNKLLRDIASFKKTLIIWGGPETVEAWNNYEILSSSSPDAKTMIKEMEKILRSIRKDLGHNDTQLKFGHLSALILVPEEKKRLFDM